jgi:hypothetical protein
MNMNYTHFVSEQSTSIQHMPLTVLENFKFNFFGGPKNLRLVVTQITVDITNDICVLLLHIFSTK